MTARQPPVDPAIRSQAHELRQLGEQARLSGDLATAATYFEREIAVWESIDNKERQVRPLKYLVEMAIQQQEWATAFQHLHRIVSLPDQVLSQPKFRATHGWIFRQLGLVEGHLGHHALARHHFALASTLSTLRLAHAERDTLWAWGQFEYQAGDRDAGQRLCALAILSGIRVCENLSENGMGLHDLHDAAWQLVMLHQNQLAQMMPHESE